MNDYRRIAQENHEEAGVYTSRSVNRHGLTVGQRREKKIHNRVAKRKERDRSFQDQDE